MISRCPGFRIQPDWDRSITAGEGEIWFHQYEDGVTKYHKLERQGSDFIPSADGCQCYYYPPNILQIRSATTGVKRTFQSPDLVIQLPYSKERPRVLEGHVAEIYRCRFFPSGLAAITAGADMQLKIWCLLTGRCAATLAPGLAGGVTGVQPNSNEPGGHRAGVMDMGIIHRGRNIVSVDRAGWLRLWDVGTQALLMILDVGSPPWEIVNSPHDKPRSMLFIGYHEYQRL
ncbi:unnamed protein product [Echinostoma caproni]|uniref:WD_REPEATS_REGION domain-containing protein n=1 Tax=Echinostoma caproni TaxID=27848 RepID=A0A183B4W8_9TREM|nr:unnamed protein product [Echinostoma caproni]